MPYVLLINLFVERKRAFLKTKGRPYLTNYQTYQTTQLKTMKLEKITLTHLRMPLVSHFETSFGRIFDRDSILIAIRAEGIVGYGECVADRDPGYAYETSGTA
ncbi:MAG: hypothetical protein B6I38_07435, partial [Anaerolineaceae bacterium 4572_5.1]